MLRKAFILASALLGLASGAYSQSGQAGPADSTGSVVKAGTAADAETGEAPESDLRKPRAWALSGEVGMNSLSSLIGPVVTVYLQPRLALDMGIGLSTVGFRPGIRGRYLFSQDKVAYYAGLGFKYGPGTGDRPLKVEDPENHEPLEITVEPSPYGDMMLGVEFLADNGFLVIANLGYSYLLRDKNYSIEGNISDKAAKAYKTIFGNGLMLSVSLGKAF